VVVGDEVGRRLRQLETEEHDVSRRRTKLHERLSLFPSPAAEQLERTLSARRRELHAEIDRLRRALADPPRPSRTQRTAAALSTEVLPGLDARRRRLVRLGVFAALLASIDLEVKHLVATPVWALHHRSLSWALASIALLLAVIPLTRRVESTAVMVGAAVLSGGVLGNLLSAVMHGMTVPNPFLVVTPHGGIAFNLADTFIVAGNLILVVALCTLAVRRRAQLPGAVALAHAVRPPADS